MGEDTPQPCAVSSRESGEPLLGTGQDGITRWLLVEVRRAWDRKVPGAVFDREVTQHLERLAAAAHVRLQFIRRPRRTGPCSLFWAAGQEGGGVVRVDFDRPEALLELETDSLEQRLEPSEPLYFVCTHGRRDACCAREGLSTYRRLEQRVGERVWQTSHLGGHRFAPVVLWLSQNYLLGRVTADDVDEVLACTEEGLVPPTQFVRGRNHLTPAEQAAESLLREQLRASQAHEPWPVLAAAQHPDHTRVTFDTDSGAREIAVALRGTSLPVVKSCGEEPEPRRTWIRVGD